VLRTRSYGESDRIVTFITQDHGKLTGIAKGAKNSRKRFGGTLEPFVHVRVFFRIRPASDLAFLLRCELIAPLRGFTEDLDRWAAGNYVLELTDRMVMGREPGAEIYRLVSEALTLLDAGTPPTPLLRAFEMHLLTASGWAPAIDRCRDCNVAAQDDGTLYLDAHHAGLLCRRCVPQDHPVRPVRGAVALALARLADGPLAGASRRAQELSEARPGAPSWAAEIHTVAEYLVGAVTHGPLRSRAFLDSLAR
jgi:DNA repair protein RecO (recombination protein O)